MRSTTSASNRRPRVLYLSFYFPPTRASGVFRGRATANHLSRAGWDVTVVTPQREFFSDFIRSYDPSLENAVEPEVRVERVRFPGRLWEPDIRRYSAFRGNFPAQHNSIMTWLEAKAFPEAYAPWIPRAVRAAAKLHRDDPFDVVLATGNPHASFAAAWALNRLLRIPYLLDYRDSWTLNLFDDAPAYPPDHPAWKWERRVLSRASKVIFVNDPLKQWHAERYPEMADRMIVVQNGWDPEMLNGVAEPSSAGPERPLRLGYLGTVTTKVPLDPFIEGWRWAREDPELAGSSVHFHGHLGFFPNSGPVLRSALAPHQGIDVHYQGPVRKADVGTIYGQLDILLLILAGSRYVTSGKVYEYMATGRPIVSVHPVESAASDILAGYPLWFPVDDLSPLSIRDALLAAARAARTLDPSSVAAAREYAGQMTRDTKLMPLEAALREVTCG